jgi:hypothetical protein
MAANKPDDHRRDIDPALAQILQGGHDRATTEELLRWYQQKRHERLMLRCQQGWEATHDPAFIVEAQVLIDFDERPPPPWLSEAIYDVAMKGRAKEYVTRAHNALVRRRRYEAVCDAKSAGITWAAVTWEAAYAEAAKALAKTPARGEPGTMKAAYDDVARDIREGRGDLYLTPHPERGEVLKRRRASEA